MCLRVTVTRKFESKFNISNNQLVYIGFLGKKKQLPARGLTPKNKLKTRNAIFILYNISSKKIKYFFLKLTQTTPIALPYIFNSISARDFEPRNYASIIFLSKIITDY